MRLPSIRNSAGTKVSTWFQGLPAAMSDYRLIETQTVGAGGAASLTFNVPAGYTHLQVRGVARANRSGQTIDALHYYLNSDTTDTHYNNHSLYGSGTSASSSYNAGTNVFASFLGYIPATNAASGTFGALVWDLLDHSSTSKNKVSRSLGGYDLNGSGTVELDSVLWLSTAAVTSVTFAPVYGTGFAQYTTFSLYGIRSAGASTAGTPTYDLIEERVLTGTSASETFGAGGTLTQAYKDIVVEVVGGPSAGTDLLLQLNGDTGSHYSMTEMVGNGTSALSYRRSNATFIDLDYTPGASGTVSQTYTANVMSYANANVYKPVLVRSGSASTSTEAIVGQWRGSSGSSTEAVTSLLLKCNSGNIIAGTTFRLWGIK